MKDLPKDHPPICKDCKYYVKQGGMEFGGGRCASFLDVVSGIPFHCKAVRYHGICGIEGKYFEPKPKKRSWWKRLLGKN